jgi:hypothetical protein
MKRIRQILLFVLFAFMSTSLSAQTDTETLVQNLQTANFNKLLLSWDNQVEVNLPNQSGQKQYSPAEANELLRSFFNRNNIIGFEKKEDRKVGSTIYLTGKLISGTVKYNLTILLQESKKGFAIISLRVS